MLWKCIRIAKTLSFVVDEKPVIVVMSLLLLKLHLQSLKLLPEPRAGAMCARDGKKTSNSVCDKGGNR